MVIIKYENESEVQGIIGTQTALGMHLVAVSNVGEGNFLGFDDRDVVPIVTPAQATLNDINNTANMILLKQEGII